MKLKEQSVDYSDRDSQLRGLLVSQDHPAKRPGVLVLHGGAGLDDHARQRARQLAGLGLVSFACDMYGVGVTGDRERVLNTLAELTRDRDLLCRRALAGLSALVSTGLTSGIIAAVGYCFGGRTALELARSGVDLAGVISVHGSLETTERARPGEVKTKILVCHGALDPYVPPQHVSNFIEEMNAAEADYQLTVYGGAVHGFTHDGGPPPPGVAYHSVSDARSFAAVTRFLSETLDIDATAG